MPNIIIETVINSDIETCFNLARSIEVHEQSFKFSKEKAIAGKTSGLVNLGDWVSWEAKHLFFVQHLTSKITAFELNKSFTCVMIFGVFKTFKQDYSFEMLEDKRVLMTDSLFFESPLGVLGKLFNFVFLKRYVKCILKQRDHYIKHKAEHPVLPKDLTSLHKESA